ncbi:MAG TPA: hypothetical protein VH539_09195 [Gemmatimonadaceae bacterium]|jgi:hypothetical protein
MSDVGLRPRSATELVDAAFQLYRREPLQFIIGFGIVYIPWMVLAEALGLNNPRTSPPLPNIVIGVLGGVVVYAMTGVVTILANDLYFDRTADLGRALRAVASRFVPLTLTLIIAMVATIFGIVLFVVPGFYMLAHFFAVKQAVLLEGAGTGAALRRSGALSKGYKKHVLSTILIVSLLYLALVLGAGFFSRLIPSLLVQRAISTIVTTLVYPIFGITEMLLYYDIRIRKEGFDIEYLASGALEKDAVAT